MELLSSIGLAGRQVSGRKKIWLKLTNKWICDFFNGQKINPPPASIKKPWMFFCSGVESSLKIALRSQWKAVGEQLTTNLNCKVLNFFRQLITIIECFKRDLTTHSPTESIKTSRNLLAGWLASCVSPVGRMGAYTRDESLWEGMLPMWTSEKGYGRVVEIVL